MPGLASIATLSYNGYTFDGSAKVRVARNNIRDEADRTTVCMEVTLQVMAVVALPTGATVDGSLDTIKQALTCEGGILNYSNAGFGGELNNVNSGPKTDVRWGPKPRMISWIPIGSHSAAEIIWEVTTWLPPCTLTSRQTGLAPGIMAVNYEVSFAIDNVGLTTRTINGYYEIMLTRGGSSGTSPCQARQLQDTADRYRANVFRNVPTGFKRTHEWKLSKDKRRMDFTIVDTEKGSRFGYPRDFPLISARHTTRISRGSMAKIRNTLSMTVTPGVKLPPAQAWQYFIQLFKSRKQVVEQRNMRVLASEVQLEEDIFGLPVAFRLDYYNIPASIDTSQQNPIVVDPIGQSGLFTPPPANADTTVANTSYDNQEAIWFNSLANGPFHPYGARKLIDSQTNDLIIDPCTNRGLNLDSYSANVGQEPSYTPQTGSLDSSKFTGKEPYLQYHSSTTVHGESPTNTHVPLQDSGVSPGNPNPEVVPNDSPDPPFDNKNIVEKAAEGFKTDGLIVTPSSPSSSSSGTAKVIIQRTGKYHWRVLSQGYCKRIGFPIPRPASVQKIGGVTAHEIVARVNPRYVGMYGKIPIFSMGWYIIYALDSAPTAPIKPNWSPIPSL